MDSSSPVSYLLDIYLPHTRTFICAGIRYYPYIFLIFTVPASIYIRKINI